MSKELNGIAAAPDNTLSKFSDQEIEALAKILAKEIPPLWESLFINLSGIPQFNKKLDDNLLQQIKDYNPIHPNRAQAFLNIIKTWPEMTLEIVAHGLDDIGENDIANKVRGHIVSIKPRQPLLTNTGTLHPADKELQACPDDDVGN
jgi:hypothetical protein